MEWRVIGEIEFCDSHSYSMTTNKPVEVDAKRVFVRIREVVVRLSPSPKFLSDPEGRES